MIQKISKALLFLIVISFPSILYSQSAEGSLEQAVKYYNDMRDYEDNLNPKTVNQSDIDSLKAYIQKAQPLLDYVKSNGNDEQKTTAKYFNANLQYELGFVYGMMGKNKEAYDVLNTIESDYEYFSSSNLFPLKYVFFGKNYSIKYDNFSPTLAEYYTGMAEICANLNKNVESLKWSKISLNSTYGNLWYRYISLNKAMEVKKKMERYDQELIDLALMHMEILTQLDTSYIRTIKEYNYPTEKTSFNTIVTAIEKNSELLNNGESYKKAIDYLIKKDNRNLIMECYARGVVTGVRDNIFLFKAAEHFLADDANPEYTQKLGKPYLAEKAANDLYTRLPVSSNCAN